MNPELVDRATKVVVRLRQCWGTQVDRQEAYVQADPTHFHMQRREAIFELEKQTEPYDDTVGCAQAMITAALAEE